MVFDGEGGLLVVEQDKGVSRVTFDDGEGGCVRGKGDKKVIIEDESVSVLHFLFERYAWSLGRGQDIEAQSRFVLTN